MKKLFTLMLGLLSCTLLLCLSVNAVELYVDTELVQTDVPPQLVGGRTLVPMRAIFEYLGAEVTWDNDTRTATGTLNDTVVIIQIDNTTAYVNDVPYTLDVPAQIIGNRTMVFRHASFRNRLAASSHGIMRRRRRQLRIRRRASTSM